MSDPDSYLELEESVKAHAYDLSLERGRLVSRTDAARHWYEVVFAPSIELARGTGAAGLLASCSDADLFLVLRRGINMPFDPDWQVPAAASERGQRNIAAAAPSRVSRALGAIGRRHVTRPQVLEERQSAPDPLDDRGPATEGEARANQPDERTEHSVGGAADGRDLADTNGEARHVGTDRPT